MTCRRRINSAQLRQDLTKARRVVTNATADSTEEGERFTQANREDRPGDQSDDETDSRMTTAPSGHQTTMQPRSKD